MKLYALIIAAFLSTPTFAAEVSIEMLIKMSTEIRWYTAKKLPKLKLVILLLGFQPQKATT